MKEEARWCEADSKKQFNSKKINFFFSFLFFSLHGVVPVLGNAQNVAGERVNGHRGVGRCGSLAGRAVIVPSTTSSTRPAVSGAHHRIDDALLVGR
jgi:hypothetical protein